MNTPTTIDMSTGIARAIIITSRENVRSSERVYGLCHPACTDEEIRSAAGKSEITMSGFPSVKRDPTDLGVHVQRFIVKAYTGD